VKKQEIIDAVKAGKSVKWENDLYDVLDWGEAGFCIVCSQNNHGVGLKSAFYNQSDDYDSESFYVVGE